MSNSIIHITNIHLMNRLYECDSTKPRSTLLSFKHDIVYCFKCFEKLMKFHHICVLFLLTIKHKLILQENHPRCQIVFELKSRHFSIIFPVQPYFFNKINVSNFDLKFYPHQDFNQTSLPIKF
jgi:hypothetical protein